MRNMRPWSCAVALALAFGADAGVNTFTPTGPDGGMVLNVEHLGGNTLLATTYRWVYRSADGGVTWTRARVIANPFSIQLAVNPLNPNQVLLTDGGLLRSADGGATWTPVDAFAQTLGSYLPWVKFSDDGSAWVARTSSNSIFRSSDGGANWTEIPTGLTQPVYTLSIDPADSQRMYFQTADGAYYSSDGGTHVTPLTFAQYVNTVTASRTTANTALAFSSDIYRLFRTTNGGVDWTATAWQPLSGRQLQFLQYAPSPAGKAFVQDTDFRVHRLADDGAQSVELGFVPVGRMSDMAFDPANPAHVYVAGLGGIFESTDDGVTWIERNRGLREGSAVGLVTSYAGSGAVYMRSRDLTSVWRRADNGDWTAAGRNSSPLLGSGTSLGSWFGTYTLGVSQQDAQRLYMARDGRFGVSTDGGTSWSYLSAVPDADAMSVSTVNDKLIFLSVFSPASVRSTNGGLTWTSLSGSGLPQYPDGVRRFAFDPTNANVVYAAVNQLVNPGTAAVYKSVDGGAHFAPTAWQPQSLGTVFTLVHDPVRANILYLVSSNGVYKTVDGGANWAVTPLFQDKLAVSGGPGDLIVDPQSPDVLYASAWQQTWLARSVDAGASWEVTQDSDAPGAFNQLALVPGSRGKLVAQRWDGSREYEYVARVAITTSAAPAMLNTPSTSVLSVVNQGDFTVSKARLTATLPPAAGAPTITASSGTCTLANGTALSCELGNIAPKRDVTVTVGYTPTQAGTWSASASVYETEDTTTDNTLQVAMSAPVPPPAKSAGGGGRLDYLLLALLGAGLARRFRTH